MNNLPNVERSVAVSTLDSRTHSHTSFIGRFDEIESAIYDAPSRVSLFSDSAFLASLTARLDGLIGADDVLSLDVFDTLVWRDNSSELTRFVEIGKCMSDLINARCGEISRCIDPIDAFLARHMGTKATYRAGAKVDGCREGSLTEIHRTASRLLTGKDELADDLISVELGYEATRITPNDFILSYVDRHRKRGGQCVLISDMYMHAEQIRELLCKLGIDVDQFDLLISSADTKVSKASGGLFARVEALLQRPPESFLHVGDSLRGDFQQPVKHGWRALHLPVPRREIEIRRLDHGETAARLAQTHGLSVDIALPH